MGAIIKIEKWMYRKDDTLILSTHQIESNLFYKTIVGSNFTKLKYLPFSSTLINSSHKISLNMNDNFVFISNPSHYRLVLEKHTQWVANFMEKRRILKMAFTLWQRGMCLNIWNHQNTKTTICKFPAVSSRFIVER